MLVQNSAFCGFVFQLQSCGFTAGVKYQHAFGWMIETPLHGERSNLPMSRGWGNDRGYTDSLIQERDVHEEKFRKPSRKFHSDWELANFCHGGDLDED